MMIVPSNTLHNADLTLLTKKLLPVCGSVMAELTSGQGSNAVYQDQFDAMINDTGLQSLHHNATLPSYSAVQAFQIHREHVVLNLAALVWCKFGGQLHDFDLMQALETGIKDHDVDLHATACD